MLSRFCWPISDTHETKQCTIMWESFKMTLHLLHLHSLMPPIWLISSPAVVSRNDLFWLECFLLNKQLQWNSSGLTQQVSLSNGSVWLRKREFDGPKSSPTWRITLGFILSYLQLESWSYLSFQVACLIPKNQWVQLLTHHSLQVLLIHHPEVFRVFSICPQTKIYQDSHEKNKWGLFHHQLP